MSKKGDCKKSHFKDHVESMTHPFCFFFLRILFRVGKKKRKVTKGERKAKKKSEPRLLAVFSSNFSGVECDIFYVGVECDIFLMRVSSVPYNLRFLIECRV